MKTILKMALVAVAVGLAGCTATQTTARIPSPTTATNPAPVLAAQEAHGIAVSRQAESLSAHVVIKTPDKTMVDGDFIFELNGPRARHDAADGSTTVYDGSDCWVSPADLADPMDRFHVWTWPWFIIAPLKMTGEGIHLSDHKQLELNGKTYDTYLQTFRSDMGDAPDDWYRLFIDPQTHELAAMAYIVSYGKTPEPNPEKVSIIVYHDYQDVHGIRLASRYEFWYWNEESGLIGGGPKFTGTVSLFRLNAHDATTFAKPDGAVSVAVPTPAAK